MMIDGSAPLRDQPRKVTPRSLARFPGYPCYRTVEETYSDLSQLATAYPELASWADVGDSWDKVTAGGATGYDLFALVLTNKTKPGPKFKYFIMAAIHARELVTTELAARFAEKLLADYGVDPEVTWLLDYGEVHIIPIVNPDGRKQAEQGYSWRKNTDTDDGCVAFPNYGVDLNRNSSFHWGAGNIDPCHEMYQGPSPVSEPEIQAIRNYIEGIFTDQRGPGDDDPAPSDATGLFVSLHSYKPAVIFPYEFRSTAAPNKSQLETLGRKFGFFNGYQVCQSGDSGCMYLASGTADDWVYGQLGVAAYTFELGTNYFQSCSNFEGAVVPRNMPALLYAFKAARRPYQSPAGPESLSATISQDWIIPGTALTLTAVADDTRYNSNGWGSEPVQNIAAARYSVDAPSWIAGVAPYSMTAADGAFDGSVETVQAIVDTTGWTPGYHSLFVESQDAAGNWGVPSAVYARVADWHGVALAPKVARGQAYPGQTARYTLRVTNMGSVPDTFDLAADGYSWTTTVPSSVGPLAGGASADLTVTVSVPPGASGGATGMARIVATSRGDNAQSATAMLVTTASFHGLVMTPSSSAGTADPGAQVTHTLRVTNTGNLTDTFDVAVSGNAWATSAASRVGPLAASVSAPVNVVVTVPASALAGTKDAARITLTSRGDPSQSAGAVLTTTANTVYRVAVAPAAATRWGDPGTLVTYTLRVTNTGNIADTLDVAVSGGAWPTAVASAVGPLAAWGNTDLSVTVTVPSAALAGVRDTARITLTSRGNPSQSAAAALTTTVNAVYQFVAEPLAATRWGDPGTQVTYTLRVTNTGNIADTFDVGVSGNAWPTAAASAVGPVAVGGSTGLGVVVTVPETATGGATDAVRISVTSRGSPARNSTSVLTTTANVVHRAALEPMAATGLGEPGMTVTYTLRLTNTGNVMETFMLNSAGNNWNVQLSPAISITLPAGAGSDVIAQVTIPSTVTSVVSDTAWVQAAGVGIFRVTSLTTRVVFRVYLPVTFRNP
jgi:carboxypeptidase T